MTLAQRNAIATPATGLLIYQTNNTPGFYYYNGTAWTAVSLKSANASLSNLVTTSIDSSLLPAITNSINLGSSTLRWKALNLYNLKFSDGSVQSTGFKPYTAGTGISIASDVITNSAPDKTVVLNNGTGISVSGTYPAFTITNTIPKGWSLTGNANTDSSINFIGTTDAHPLVFRIKNVKSGIIDSTYQNTSLGYASLFFNSTGNSNTAEGYHALYATTTGHDNTATGGSVLFKNTTGSNNTADGAGALYNNLTGSGNVALGKFALYSNTNANSLVAIGDSALFNNTAGTKNTANGFEALYNNTTGNNNTSTGYTSLLTNTTGYANTANGDEALYWNTTGYYNTATGTDALALNTTGYDNTANGVEALYSNTTGVANTAGGYYSLVSNTTGGLNTAMGNYALATNTTGNYNTAIGSYALNFNSTASNNTANGYAALYNNSTGSDNSALGFDAMWNNTTGSSNTAIGKYALYANTQGYNNIAMGSTAMYSNKTGFQNIANGYGALYSNTSGHNNVAIGIDALHSNTTGHHHIAIGDSALYSQTALDPGDFSDFSNIAIGPRSLYSNTTGVCNTAVGPYALSQNTDGINNTAVGYQALDANPGSQNTAIGAFAGVFSSDVIVGSTALGWESTVTASSQVRVGSGNSTSIGGYTDWSNISDGRVKKNIKQNVPELSFINRLQPITYNLDLDAADKIIQRPQIKDKNGKTIQPSKFDIEGRKAKEQIVYTGFVAQDVEKVAKSLNYDFSGVDAAKNDRDLYGLRYGEFVVPLVKAVQELSEMNDAKDEKIDSLQNRLANVETQLNNIKILVESIQQTQQQCSPCAASHGQNISQSTVVLNDAASLQQNIPNPFAHTTSIGYTLPQKFSSAKIIVTDKSGNVLKEVNVSNSSPAGGSWKGAGKGNLTIDASTLASGAYQYSLVVDGRLIATKQMILAK
jgi:hypothetical protein